MSKKTRILNISPKAQLAITDSNQKEYPTILRTSDERVLGNDTSIFDDAGTQNFIEQNVIMPYNASKMFVERLGFLTGTISIDKSITPASQFLTSYKDETFIPYNESRNPSSFFGSGSEDNAGFDETLYQGFTSPISSKIAIPIDISLPGQPKIVSVAANVAGTTSPFVYYNFSNKTWDEIGPTDPVTGALTGYIHAIQGGRTTVGPNTWLTGSIGVSTMVKQFTSSPGVASDASVGTVTALGSLKELGYDKIGYPTSFFEAPNAPRYHAKTSQTLKLSKYIQHPFILEKIEVQIPISATRNHIQVPSGLTYAGSGTGRDIDNHVFFIYRQNRVGHTTDTVQDVSSSIRSIIGNESFCFYNRPSMPNTGVSRLTPIHENQLEVNYALPLASWPATKTVGPYLLNMVFTPKTYERQFTAVSAVHFVSDLGGANQQYTTGYNQNYWNGGNKTEAYTTKIMTSKISPEFARSFQTRFRNSTSDVSKLGKMNFIDSTFDFDPRTLRSSTWNSSEFEPVTGNPYFTGEDVTSTNLSYRKNLYILLPEDELVFGIDAGLFPTYKPDASVTPIPNTDLPPGYLETISSTTDIGGASDSISKLTIHQGEARVVLYGTLIKDGVEVLSTSNQKLVSTAIHEDVHEIVTDQFQINETKLYSGSYITNYITGAMGSSTSPRQLVSVLDHTLSRAVTHVDFTRIMSNSTFDPNALPSSIILGVAVPNISKLSQKSSAKFRFDRFGQFSDMLEQMLDSKSTQKNYISRNFPTANFITTFGSTQISSPVYVNFVSQSSEISVAPIDTRSGNLSFECTSSIPYFEDRTRKNRPDIVFTTNKQFSVETIVLNKPSSLLSST